MPGSNNNGLYPILENAESQLNTTVNETLSNNASAGFNNTALFNTDFKGLTISNPFTDPKYKVNSNLNINVKGSPINYKTRQMFGLNNATGAPSSFSDMLKNLQIAQRLGKDFVRNFVANELENNPGLLYQDISRNTLANDRKLLGMSKQEFRNSQMKNLLGDNYDPNKLYSRSDMKAYRKMNNLSKAQFRNIQADNAYNMYDPTTMSQSLETTSVTSKVDPNTAYQGMVNVADKKTKYLKKGGKMYKFQQGGQLPSITDLVIDMLASGQEEAVMLAVNGLTQMGEQANAVVQEIAQRAEQGEEKAVAAAQVLQQVMQSKQQQAQKALNGAKLQYIKNLQGICNDDEEIVYFKAGGQVWSKKVKKTVEKDCGGTKVTKQSCGGTTKAVKNIREKMSKGNKISKCEIGGTPTNPSNDGKKPKILPKTTKETSELKKARELKRREELRRLFQKDKSKMNKQQLDSLGILNNKYITDQDIMEEAGRKGMKIKKAKC